jgi:hypothetical protein
LLPERELTEPVHLVGPDGRFNREAIGWSRHPLHICNVYEPLQRRKKWNYWAVTSDEVLFSATIADMERAFTAGSYLFHRPTKRYVSKGVRRPPETIAVPEGVHGDMVIEHPDMTIGLTDAGTGTRIRVTAGDFGGRPLEADIVVTRPDGHETLNVVIPWNDRETQFTSKQNTLPATGFVQWGDERFEFGAGSFGCLDYGRGVWPEHTVWNWGAASGLQDGRTIGFNIGDKWTTGTGMTENGLCVDGRLTKISEELVLEYDRTDWMRPWRVRTPVTDRMDLTFTPEFDRHEETGRRDKYFTEVHQMFGTYSGTIRPEGEGPLAVRDLFGWIEEHEARW